MLEFSLQSLEKERSESQENLKLAEGKMTEKFELDKSKIKALESEVLKLNEDLQKDTED